MTVWVLIKCFRKALITTDKGIPNLLAVSWAFFFVCGSILVVITAVLMVCQSIYDGIPICQVPVLEANKTTPIWNSLADAVDGTM